MRRADAEFLTMTREMFELMRHRNVPEPVLSELRDVMGRHFDQPLQNGNRRPAD